MVPLQAVALLYPSLLTFIASNPNYTIFANDHGSPYLIETREHELTYAQLYEICQSVEEISFTLYTRNSAHDGHKLFIGNLESLKNSSWNPSHPTRFVTHGWQGNCDIPTCTLIRDAYLEVDDYNVILIDWRNTAASYLYWKVAECVPFVAERVTQLINFLEENGDLNPKQTKLIGHSLGSHVAGLAARSAKSQIAEVIALDPARPLFHKRGPGERVDKSDAVHVQIIHTNAGMLGIEHEIGTSDFYPNDGEIQPGCEDLFGACSHARSYQYYAESISNPTGFRAEKVYMGGPVLDQNARGKYTLKTADKSPYALG